MTNKRKKGSIKWKGLFTPLSYIQMMCGVGVAVLALKGFMIPNSFLDGGVTGISLLLHEVLHWNVGIPLIILNTFFIIITYQVVSKEVAIRSVIAIVMLVVALQFVHIEPVTKNKLLISIFGGVLIGIGMGLVIRAGAILDGFEIIAVLTTRRIGLSMSEVIVVFNTILFLVAAFFLGIETAMYSIITYFVAAKASDYIVDGVEEYTALTIICSKSEEVKSLIVNDYGKGISVYKGERGYLPGNFETRTDCDIIVTIVTRLELLGLKRAISELDPTAFMYVNSIKETSGGVVKKKSGHHDN